MKNYSRVLEPSTILVPGPTKDAQWSPCGGVGGRIKRHRSGSRSSFLAYPPHIKPLTHALYDSAESSEAAHSVTLPTSRQVNKLTSGVLWGLQGHSKQRVSEQSAITHLRAKNDSFPRKNVSRYAAGLLQAASTVIIVGISLVFSYGLLRSSWYLALGERVP